MEHKMELVYMGAAAIIFAASIMGWFSMEKQLNESLVIVEQQAGEDHVIIRTGGN